MKRLKILKRNKMDRCYRWLAKALKEMIKNTPQLRTGQYF